MPESPSSNPQDVQPRHPRGLLPPTLVDLLVPALKVGVLTGGTGFINGVAAGIVKDVYPVLFGIASGVQCFALGSSFWLSRSIAIRAWGGEHNLTPRDRIKVSAVGGVFAGMVGGLIRGPRNIIPGMVVLPIFGAAGQGFVNKVHKWKGERAGAEETSWLSSKWSPLRKLSDEEYENYMSEKMLKVEAEIALIDDKIAELREEERAKEGGEVPPKASLPPADVQKGVEAQAGPQEAGKSQKSSWWR